MSVIEYFSESEYSSEEDASPDEDMLSKLARLRSNMRDLLRYWDRVPDYRTKELSFRHYLHFLYSDDPRMHAGKSDLAVDLEILEDLITKMADNVAEGDTCYLEHQIAGLWACTKAGMMLQELDRIIKEYDISIPNDSWYWIKEKIQKEGWVHFRDYVTSWKPIVAAKALAKGGQYAELVTELENFKLGEINIDDPEAIQEQLKVYLKEVKDSHEVPPGRHMDCIGRAKGMLELMEEVRSGVSDRYSQMPDDDHT